jgi:hypothetical protein
MTAEPDGARPQDVGRSRKRKGAPSPATQALIDRYQESMRAELAALLDELKGSPPPPGILADVEAVIVRPPLKDRAALWDLAIKLGRELGSAIDATPAPAIVGPGRRRRAPNYG